MRRAAKRAERMSPLIAVRRAPCGCAFELSEAPEGSTIDRE